MFCSLPIENVKLCPSAPKAFSETRTPMIQIDMYFLAKSKVRPRVLRGIMKHDLAMVSVSSSFLSTSGFILPHHPSVLSPTVCSFSSQPCHHVEHDRRAMRAQSNKLRMARRCRANRISNLPMSNAEMGGERDGMVTTEQVNSSKSKEKGIYGYDQDIVDREVAEAPFRRTRLIAYGAFALTALVLGCVSLAGLAGFDQVKDLSENLPNPLLDAAVIGITFYLWVEEVKTKRSALRLIEKRVEEEARVPNRSTRRQNISKKQSKVPAVMATAGNAGTTPSKASKPVSGDPVAAAATTPPSPDDSDKQASEGKQSQGMFTGLRKTLEDVNQQSYYQALALNKDLEDKGVLPRLERPPAESSSMGATEEVVGDAPVQGGEIVGGNDDNGVGGVEAEVMTSAEQRTTRGSQQRKRKGRKTRRKK